MSLNLCAPIRNGPNLTIQNHTRFEKQKRPIFTSQKKLGEFLCKWGSCSLWQKQGAPFAGGAIMAMFKTGSMQWGHGRLKKSMGKQQNMYEILFHTAEKTQYDAIVNEVIQKKKYDEF